MNSETVDLIATDPPFNKKRNRAGSAGQYEDAWRWEDDPRMKKARPDQWKWQPVNREWLEEIEDNNPALFAVIEATRLSQDDDTAAYLCFLGVRLMEMRRILKPTGTIYLHCDHSANAYIRMVMDAVFKKSNFIEEIVWNYGTPSGGRSAGKKPINCHDTIFVYAKSRGRHTYIQQFTPYREKYMQDWFRHTDEDGRMYRTRSRKGKIVRQYLDESPGVPLSTVWSDIMQLYGSAGWFPTNDKERTGSPDQKPLALYERIIKASSNPGDLVLDPFAGCATTPIAAHRLGRRWVGIDRRTDGFDYILARLKQEGILVPENHPRQTPLEKDGVILAKHSKRTPVRTDDRELAAPDLPLPPQRVKAKWELLKHQEMREILADAQRSNGKVICAGCGIDLPRRYMELDHIQPKKEGGDHSINNRILLCGPCNRAKKDRFTLTGLIRENKKLGFLVDESLTKLALANAKRAAERCRAEML